MDADVKVGWGGFVRRKVLNENNMVFENWLDLSVVFDKLWVKFDMGSYCFRH